MNAMNSTAFALYNPALLPPDVLLAEYTARRDLLETLLRVVRENERGKPPQHVILIGARGTGKTTTLWAVAHSIARDPELARAWQPVVFDEESRRVGDLADFWLESIRQWEFATHSDAGQAERLLNENPPELETQARQTFLAAVGRSGKRALLCIDNLNDIFASIHDPESQHRLRAFLMEDDRVMFLGAATQLFDAVTGLDQPFFDFFRRFELAPLSLAEMRAALLAMAAQCGNSQVRETIETRSGTIRTLHVLTGGNPRLIKTFYRLLAEGLRGDVRQDLERLIDEFTPYFKAILDALPMQQQRVIDAVALAWEPVEVASIARATRLPSNQVSAQLRNLTRSGLVVEAAGTPKRKTYLLSDRFSNIHYLMRHGRAARRRFDWFVLTLGALFPNPEQAEAIAGVAARTACAGEEGLRDTRDLLSSALTHAEDEQSRLGILHATFKATWDQETHDQLQRWLDLDLAKQHLPTAAGELDIMAFFAHMPRELRKKLGYNPENATWWYQLTDTLEAQKVWMLAEAAYRKAIELDPTSAYPWNGLGNLLQDHFDRYAEAEAAYRKAIELDPTYACPWNGLGNLLKGHFDRYAEAEAAYRKAIELDPTVAYPWHNLGILLQNHLGRYAEAETAYRKAIELAPNYARPYSGLAKVLQRDSQRLGEARVVAGKGLLLDPAYGFARWMFTRLCQGEATSWREVLPTLADWCVSHPGEVAVFDFVVDGLIRLARLAGPVEVLNLLDGASDPQPFETVRDALFASGNREHLHRLAPERRVAVLEIMRRISEKPQANGVEKQQ